MHIADTLSRAFLTNNPEAENCDDVFNIHETFVRKTWENVKMITDHEMEESESQRQEIRSETRNDEELDSEWLARQRK